MTPTIIHRRLIVDEAHTVHNELKATPNILGYSIRELLRLTDVHVAEVDGSFAGTAVSVDLLFGWTEIAFILVCEEHRGLGIGKALFEAAWSGTESRRRHIYMLSRNQQVVDWMAAKGMTIDRNMLKAPLAVQLFMPVYMSSWYRTREAFRKSAQIRKCRPIVQGIKKGV